MVQYQIWISLHYQNRNAPILVASGLLGGLSNALFGSVNNSQYLQAMAQQQAQAQAMAQREAQAYAAQQQYQQYVQSVLNGTAPSMAQMQLMQGLGAQQQIQQSMASGLGGAGNALARYGAAQNMGQAGAAMNQSQALARVAEQNAARSQFGANAAAMQNASGNMAGMYNQTGLGYANIGAGVDKFNQQQQFMGSGAILQGLGQAGAGYLSGTSPQPAPAQNLYSQAQPGLYASQTAGQGPGTASNGYVYG